VENGVVTGKKDLMKIHPEILDANVTFYMLAILATFPDFRTFFKKK
jgi:hypothetical protein